jgi:hypothetical protein
MKEVLILFLIVLTILSLITGIIYFNSEKEKMITKCTTLIINETSNSTDCKFEKCIVNFYQKEINCTENNGDKNGNIQ